VTVPDVVRVWGCRRRRREASGVKGSGRGDRQWAVDQRGGEMVGAPSQPRVNSGRG
jgi:hypothetical protein